MPRTDATKVQDSDLLVGIDVGSTTTKVVALDAKCNTVLYSDYARHGARQVQSVIDAFDRFAQHFPGASFRMAICGSGAKTIAEALDVPFVQEVVANATAVCQLYPQARCAIELGGQDAKMIFFRPNEKTGQLDVADMRMNGSCAGGTGAFIDEMAILLKIPTSEFDDLAAKGTTLFDISGRCGVYAKTDIQPLLNQGAAREDLALSIFHAIAKQTIGGLAQGLDIEAPVVLEGGPLTFNPTLQRVFAERLNLKDEDIIVPDQPQLIVALGTALSLKSLFKDESALINIDTAGDLLTATLEHSANSLTEGHPLFASEAEKEAFLERHAITSFMSGPALLETRDAEGANNEPLVVEVGIGIDSGSTTTKFVLLDQEGQVFDSFYAHNEGDPIGVTRQGLIEMRDRYRSKGIELQVTSCGTTGYGELLCAKGFHADFHTVETVAHSHATIHYKPDTTFILDIGGQDMKAIWLSDGIITDIVVNEACSSGCGSFLENFADSLGIATDDIAEAAFRAKNPAELGSRCTVFMNSNVVSEQKQGKSPDDIVAGLCRSIIENVFTKVVRVSNLDSLGKHIVVQGGAFRNAATLRAFEEYVGREVSRAPYPGLMGAIGIARLAREHVLARTNAPKAETADASTQPAAATSQTTTSSFIGFDALDGLSFEQQTNVICPFCSNNCKRTVITFSDGSIWITGNRCARGEVLDKDAQALREKSQGSAPNLFELRQRLLMRKYPFTLVAPEKNIVMGVPRVLAFWDTMPFWTTLLRSLGFTVKLSHPSTRPMYEEGLSAVSSDTICFPAKLVHGHIRDLVRSGVDRIFMPAVTTVPPERAEKTSKSMCAVVKGYPLVLQNSDNPERRFDVPLEAPLFHWHSTADRNKQLAAYFEREFNIDQVLVQQAIEQADDAQNTFRTELETRGAEVLEETKREGKFAVVLASRPYHNDSLVNHDLPRYFSDLGIAVLPPDAVPGYAETDLTRSRLDIVNNFHARMLSTALIAAESPHLEYVQLVSFGCGHDAYLSDEIVRLMKERSGKVPLILKVDESDAQGSLQIRVRSFVETLKRSRGDMNATDSTRANEAAASSAPELTLHELPDPYPVKYTPADRKQKIVLVPNTSHAFCRLMSAAMAKQGIRAEPLDIGREEAIRLGKRYVHNDICFPAQMTIGEALAALESGRYDDKEVAIGTGKYIGDCRLTHYCALLRKALDDAGYEHVPIITNDDVDDHDLHPGFKFSIASVLRIAFGLPMIDALEELWRKMRPYELEEGAADRAFDQALDEVIEGLEHKGMRGAMRGFRLAIDIMAAVEYDRSDPRPRVLIVGEYLLNFHPGANHDIERYLEKNGLELIEARMTDVIRKTYFYQDAQVKEYDVDLPRSQKTWLATANRIFEMAHNYTDRIASAHPLYERATRLPELAQESDPILHRTFDAGEGILIPGEIIHYANHGCRAFVILQPFGCLPNHVCGRGIAKRLKELYPDAQILPLDYDPDVSFANVENRLQMLVMNALNPNAQATATAATPEVAIHEVVKDCEGVAVLTTDQAKQGQVDWQEQPESFDIVFSELPVRETIDPLVEELVAEGEAILARAHVRTEGEQHG